MRFKSVKSLSALSSAILLTNQTDGPTERPTPSPLPLTCALARPASSQPGFTSTAEGGPLPLRSAGARDTRMPGAGGRTAYRQLRQDNLGVETLAANLFDLKASRVSESGFTYILRLTSKESKRMRNTSPPSPNLKKILCRRPEH